MSTIHEARMVDTGRKGAALCCPMQYMYERCRSVPQLLLSSEKNREVVKESGGVSDKLDTPEHILCVQDPEQKQENKI
jgi:hypothetical protein